MATGLMNRVTDFAGRFLIAGAILLFLYSIIIYNTDCDGFLCHYGLAMAASMVILAALVLGLLGGLLLLVRHASPGGRVAILASFIILVVLFLVSPAFVGVTFAILSLVDGSSGWLLLAIPAALVLVPVGYLVHRVRRRIDVEEKILGRQTDARSADSSSRTATVRYLGIRWVIRGSGSQTPGPRK